MNLSLLDPFVLAQDCPETLIGGLRARFLNIFSANFTAARFNANSGLRKRTLNLHPFQQAGRFSGFWQGEIFRLLLHSTTTEFTMSSLTELWLYSMWKPMELHESCAVIPDKSNH